jgi:hypothetical protein
MVVVSLLNSRLWEIEFLEVIFPGKVNYSTIDDSNNLILAGQYRILDSDQPDISTPGAHQTQIYFMDGFIEI